MAYLAPPPIQLGLHAAPEGSEPSITHFVRVSYLFLGPGGLHDVRHFVRETVT